MKTILNIGEGGIRSLIPVHRFCRSKGQGLAGCLAPLLSSMFEVAADAANYQIKIFLNSQYVRMQTSLAEASDDMDNATHGNMENFKAEAGKLLQDHKTELENVCDLLKE